jgi:hypothetical protein
MHHSKLSIFFIVCGIGVVCPLFASAATNISPTSTSHWAWNDFGGWIDFYNTNSIIVSSAKLTGYASSSIGDISLDCATTRVGNICATSNYKVTNDGGGNLSGWGWNDAYGWISFDCANYGGCGVSNYRTYIDAAGNFFNYAWNDLLGWVSFNCADPGLCGTSNYKVVTSWMATSTIGVLDSSTFDTGVAFGAQFNSILWQGDQPGGTAVRFQFSASNSSSGPWNFSGPDGTDTTSYSGGPNTSLKLDSSLYNNRRYFRYRVILVSNQAQTISPRVDDVMVNWSP